MMLIQNKSWPEIKLLLLQDAGAYYITRDGWISIIVPTQKMECEFPGEAEYDLMAPDMRQVYDRGWQAEFEKDFKPKLLRSKMCTG